MSQTTSQTPAPQRRQAEWLQAAVCWIRDVLLNNWPLKLLSLTIALALWAGLITQDPTLRREKSFRNVTVAVNNAEILKRNGYIVTDDVEALLAGVDVEVEVPQMQYTAAQPGNYNIRVDLNRLERRPGLQELPILYTSTTTYGDVISVDPPTITVMVEEYVTLESVPVNIVQTGEAPEGFYAVGVMSDPSWVTVSGPRSLVELVDRVEVVMDMASLDPREGQVIRSLPFVLLDAQGTPIVSDMLQVTRESVLRERINVSVTLYTMREISVLDAQLYQGRPAEGYEVTDVYVTPSYVTVAGLRSIVESVELLQPGRLVSVAGATETVVATLDLARPLNLQWMSTNKVTVTVVIRPVQQTVRLEGVPVSLTGLPEGWTADAPASAAVSVTGPGDLLRDVTAQDVQLTCDVSGLSAGVYELPLLCTAPGLAAGDVLLETDPLTLTVTLTAPAE